MTHRFDSDRHHRRSIRLQDYNYAQAGAYFITICVQDRESLLGEVVDGRMMLNATGRAAQEVWDTLPARFPGIALDAFVIMPNHVHGVIVIGDIHVGANYRVGAIHESPLHDESSPKRRRKMLLPKIMGYFKMNTAKRANIMRRTQGARFWQRNYYEHVIRNERELNAIRQYIENNPLKWALDRDNPALIEDARRMGESPRRGDPAGRLYNARPPDDDAPDTVDAYLREAGL